MKGALSKTSFTADLLYMDEENFCHRHSVGKKVGRRVVSSYSILVEIGLLNRQRLLVCEN